MGRAFNMEEVEMKRFWVIATVVLQLPAVALGGSEDPLSLIQAKYAEIQEVVAKNPDREAMRAGIRKVMDTFVDYTELGRRTLIDRWDSLSAKQREEFVMEFKKMIQRTYVKRFNPEKKVEIIYHGKPKPTDDGSVMIETTVRSGRSEAKVDYLFHKKGGRWWAYDVIIDGVSMVKNYRKQFHDIIKREGFPGLMERIKKKNEKSGE